MSGMSAFIECGLDLPDEVVDPVARNSRRSLRGANVGVSFLELPLDAVTVDGVEKADPFDDLGNLLLSLCGVAVCAGKFNGTRVDRPESVDVSIRFLKVRFGRSEDLFLELFVFHNPPGRAAGRPELVQPD